ncbi:Coagulation factor IX [Collichthys lucidus]|uniref:Coagulation factor IX n=1 Tax=Collichthys lucidus TaxID=240159 RepID=A0A4U5VTC7_COLLU|nr:Coagulation factor IX [Collichthys lucidus]
MHCSLPPVFLDKQQASSVISRQKRNTGVSNQPASLEQVCMEKVCTYEQARSVFQDSYRTDIFWAVYVDGDQCAEKPCKNGAMCLDSVGGYDCVCKSGFSGVHCDKGEALTSASVVIHSLLIWLRVLRVLLRHLDGSSAGRTGTSVSLQVVPENDLAVIELRDRIIYKKDVVAACLPERDFAESILMTESKTVSSFQGPLMLNELAYDKLPQCLMSHPNLITNKMGCTSIRTNADCSLSSGSPLLTMYNNVFFLTGVVSQPPGADCTKGYIFQKVSRHLGWLQQIMNSRLQRSHWVAKLLLSTPRRLKLCPMPDTAASTWSVYTSCEVIGSRPDACHWKQMQHTGPSLTADNKDDEKVDGDDGCLLIKREVPLISSVVLFRAVNPPPPPPPPSHAVTLPACTYQQQLYDYLVRSVMAAMLCSCLSAAEALINLSESETVKGREDREESVETVAALESCHFLCRFGLVIHAHSASDDNRHGLKNNRIPLLEREESSGLIAYSSMWMEREYANAASGAVSEM